MDFGLLPPEVNSGLMYAGPGAGPMLAAAAAWDEVAAELEFAAGGYSAQVAGLVGQVWIGPSAAAMSAAVAPYTAWLQACAGQAAQTATQAFSAAAAYEAAFAMTVPPPVVAANRAQLLALIATNFFGQNTPAIAATEAQYMAMWAQDATAMYGYAAAAASASTLKPFDEPPQTTNQSGQARQASAVAKSAGDATSARTQSVMQLAASQQSGGVDPPLPSGSSANVAPGGAVIDPGVTVTATEGYPITFSGGMFKAVTSVTLNVPSYGETVTVPAGLTLQFQAGVTGTLTNGTVTVMPNSGMFTGTFTAPTGGLTASGAGVNVTLNSGGAILAVNTGTVITGPAVATPLPTPSSSGAAAASAASASSASAASSSSASAASSAASTTGSASSVAGNASSVAENAGIQVPVGVQGP
ncbi:PPE family protein [Mycobacterium sherrisii]|uniref:PPE family protein n=1 Tax=Mycobacterium sherrisii TaxID=243061 RepID=UPI000A1528A9|nr:PPE family protein [Mycobacterium sherrisii]MCV7031330.1 PPE family protein [Mycobacterium sherrisii]ORW78204.1 hypothetical protein AWC25_06350 [Mycobacterium sherrisii]